MKILSHFLKNNCQLSIVNCQLITFLLLVTLQSCSNSNTKNDATGTFEATEIIVSAEGMGSLLAFDIQEGQSLKSGQIVGSIDSLQLYLKIKQLKASYSAVDSRQPNIQIQMAATRQQIETAKTEKLRVENLLKANAANQKQLDDINAQIALLERQLESQKTTLESTSKSIGGESSAIEIQIAQIEDQLKKCQIISPIDGTVLVKYAEKGEFAAIGKPLFKIADTENMFLRAYITSNQLTKLKIGQKVKVMAEFGEKENKEYEGIVTWISDKSEFTPKTIQTQDERANLVYAVKIAVKNDGFLKIGMYGGIQLTMDN